MAGLVDRKNVAPTHYTIDEQKREQQEMRVSLRSW